MNRPQKKAQSFMEHAKIEAALSTCASTKVGAVAVKDGHIIAMGRNGVDETQTHCCDIFDGDFCTDDHKKFADEYEIHAEMNLILDALDRRVRLEGSEVYVTVSPCNQCLKHLKRAKVSLVIYDEIYWRDEIESLLLRAKNHKIDIIGYDDFISSLGES